MTYTIEVLLKDTDHVITRDVQHSSSEPQAWTDADVAEILTAMLGEIDRVKRPEAALSERIVVLRGFSWVVNPYEGGVVIAIEIPSGAAVAGPFDIAEGRLEAMIERVMGGQTPSQRTVH